MSITAEQLTREHIGRRATLCIDADTAATGVLDRVTVDTQPGELRSYTGQALTHETTVTVHLVGLPPIEVHGNTPVELAIP